MKLLLFLVGCTVPTDLVTELVPARIQSGDAHLPELAAPDRVFVGEEFTVLFNTYYEGCEEAGPTEVESGVGRIDVRPYTKVVRAGGSMADGYLVCPDKFGVELRQVTLRPTRTGIVRLVLHGERRTASDAVLIEVETEVEVLRR